VLLGILATQSRGALLGVLAVLFVLGAARIRSKTVIIAGLVAGGLAQFPAAAISSRQIGGSDQGVDESPEGRLIAWETAWNMAKARPLTGVGLANTVENYYFYTPIWQGENKAIHSLWLRVLAETGYVAVARSGLVSLRHFKAPGADPRVGLEFGPHRRLRRFLCVWHFSHSTIELAVLYSSGSYGRAAARARE
jgi:O-antigen ligase